MSEFIFDIEEYFILSCGRIAFSGKMAPKDFPLITTDYRSQLMKDQQVLHHFDLLAEELFVWNDNAVKKDRPRALATTDNIEAVLSAHDASLLYIVGTTDDAD